MAQLLEYIKMAFFNILSNKIRSVLTMLGIIIGISSVILILSLGNGAKKMITTQLNMVGNGQVGVQALNPLSYPITEDDADAVVDSLEGVDTYNMVSANSGVVSTAKGNFDVTVYGAMSDVQQFELTQELAAGHYYTKEEYDNAKPVCYISENDALRLFGNVDVLGMPIETEFGGKYVSFIIVGLVRDVDGSNMVSIGEDGPIYINCPKSVVDQTLNLDEQQQALSQNVVYFMLNGEADSKMTCKQIINILESRHNAKGENAYYIQSFADLMKTITLTIDLFTIFVSLVAAISLIVGGVGVMNIMLVSVTERTREIGIRKSLGAKTSSIMLQFLSESAILTMIGGILGIILGLTGAFLITRAVALIKPDYAFSPDVNVFVILGTTLFSSAVGIFFGIYPARKAAKMNPIEALRQL